MRTFLRGKVTLLFMMLGLLLAVPAVAYAADAIITDSDLVTTGDQLSRNLGTLAPGATFTADPTASPPVPASDVNFYLDCNGNNHLNSGETADLNVSATSKKDANGNTITGGTLSATSLSNFSGPSSWPADGSGGSACNSFANALIGTSNVTIVAPKKAGSYTYTVTYTLNRDTGTASNELAMDTAQSGNTDSVTVTFTFTVPNVAPVINSFQVSATDDGTSATEGQTKTYVISATDANEDSLTYDLVKDSGTATVNINPVAGSPGSFTVEFVTPGTLVLKATVDDGTGTTNATDTETKNVTVAAANTAPSTPGTPGLASGSSTPNQGTFGLTWTASNDDGKPNPPGAVTYTLQHKNSAAAAVFTDVSTSISGNSFSFTAASPEDEGTWTYRVKASDGSLSSDFSAASSAVKVDQSNPYDPTFDAGTPDYDQTGTANDWYKDSATVQFSKSTTTTNGDRDLADGSAGSGFDHFSTTPANTSGAFTLNTAGANAFSGRAVDVVGLQSDLVSGSVNVDTQKPTVSFTDCPTSPVVQGTDVTVHWTASDPGASANPATGSGLTSSSPTSGSVKLDTGAINSHTATVAADKVHDNVGHGSDEATCTYDVDFNWTGFFQPIDNKDANGNYIPNKAKAGSVIPVKFSLGGDQGLDIFYTGDLPKTYPTVVGATGCATGTSDAVEEYAPANASGLKYDPIANQYIYNWKTQSSYVGKCLMLNVKLADGTTHSALFTFVK